MRKVQDASGCLPLVELIRLDINVSAADNFVEVVDTNDVKPCAFPAFVIMAVRGIGANDAEHRKNALELILKLRNPQS